ncbi:hypothetical protein [Pseudoalteromonas phenolica]|nr:hypothetical protein [Pseudoalteromonas phenolica]|tara:strand:- start:313 stop:441 length:129 start_codon:yes stop_codon:yes gene_type:complete
MSTDIEHIGKFVTKLQQNESNLINQQIAGTKKAPSGAFFSNA